MNSAKGKPLPSLVIALAIVVLLLGACGISWLILRHVWNGRPEPWQGAAVAGAVAVGVAGLGYLVFRRRRDRPELSQIKEAERPAQIGLPVSLVLFYLSFGYAVAYFDLGPTPDHPQVTFTENLRPNSGMFFNITAKYDVIGCDDPVDVTLAAWPRQGKKGEDPAPAFTDKTVRFKLAEKAGKPREEEPGDARLLPDPVVGFPVERRHSRPVPEGGLTLDRPFPSRGRPAIVKFSTNWVERRNETSCVLSLPQFKDPDGQRIHKTRYLGKSWSAVTARQTVEIVREETNPVPRFDDNGVAAWECADTGFPAQCEATAVFRELDADDERDFNLLLISAGLSLGTALFLEALFRIA